MFSFDVIGQSIGVSFSEQEKSTILQIMLIKYKF